MCLKLISKGWEKENNQGVLMESRKEVSQFGADLLCSNFFLAQLLALSKGPLFWYSDLAFTNSPMKVAIS